MSYKAKIEQYRNGQLSDLERLAFEHELEDNEGLRTAYEAEVLAGELLLFTGAHLSDDQIIIPEPSLMDSARNSKHWMWIGGIGLSILAILFLLPTNKSTQPTNLPTLDKQQSIPMIPVDQKLEENIFIEYKETKVPTQNKRPQQATPKATIVPKSNTAKPIAKVASFTTKKEKASNSLKNTDQPLAITQSSQAITFETGFTIPTHQSFTAEITADQSAAKVSSKEKIEFNKVVNKGTSVTFESGSTILLKPGFYAEAGAAFTASIDKKQ